MPEETVGRREWLKMAGGTAAGLVVGGALGYLAKPPVEVPGPTTTVTATGGAVTVTATAAPTPTKVLAGKLEFLHSFTQGVRIDALTELISRFTALHPDVSIEQVPVPWSQVLGKWMSEWSTGVGPDIWAGTMVPDFYAMQTIGATIPIDDIYESIGPTNFQFKDALGMITVDKKLYALPLYGVCDNLLYRRDWIDKAPETWDELYTVAKKLTDPSKNRYGFAMSMVETRGIAELHRRMMQNGGEWFDADLNIDFNTPQNVECVESMMKLFWDCSPVGMMTNPAPTIDFVKGDMAMMCDNMGWVIVDLHTAGLNDEEIKRMYMNAWYPMGPRGDKATRRIWGDYKLMALGAKKPNEDVSREFMKWFYQDSNYLTFINSIPIGMIPATSSGQKKAFEHPYYQLFKEEAEVNLDTTSKGIPIGLENGYNLYSYIINTEYVETMLQKVALRDYTAKHAVEMIDAHLRDELEKAKSKAA